jgi:neutrophil factor 2
MQNFESALKNLRGNLLIDYKQLGLQYKLYSCEVIYNKAYCLQMIGSRSSEILKEMEESLKVAQEVSESRSRQISSAIDNFRQGGEFIPYRLPQTAILFVPPHTKTNVLSNMDFLGKAKVVSSVVDQDSFTGFVGAQKKREKEELSKSPVAGRKEPLSEKLSIGSKQSDRKVSAPAVMLGVGSTAADRRESKPNIPPPKPGNKILEEQSESRPRPPKPTNAPPPPRPSSRSPLPHSPSRSPVPLRPVTPTRTPSPAVPRPVTAITIKIHYKSTRSIRVASSLSFDKLAHLICKKFDKEDNQLTLWYKDANGSLLEAADNSTYQMLCKDHLEDGVRLTLWAYDKGSQSPPTNDFIKEVVAIGDYIAQFEDELTFYEGEIIQVLKDVNNDWYHGMGQDSSGIFPKSFVKDI